MIKFKALMEASAVTRKHLEILPGMASAMNLNPAAGEKITDIIVKLPIDVHDYPIENKDGLPFRDDKIQQRSGYLTKADKSMYESWEDIAPEVVTIEEAKELNEATLSKPQLKKRENIVNKLKKHRDEFEKSYGREALGVMYATATKKAIHEEKEIQKKSKSAVAKEAHKGEDVGHGGFKKVEEKAAKEYGSKKAGEKVAAAIMWKKYAKEDIDYVTEAEEPTVGPGKTDVEVTPDNAAAALVLAKKYAKLAKTGVDGASESAQKFLDTANRLNFEHKRSNPYKKHVDHDVRPRVASQTGWKPKNVVEEVEEVPSFKDALEQAVKEDGIELQMEAGSFINVTKQMAEDLLKEFQEEADLQGIFEYAIGKVAHKNRLVEEFHVQGTAPEDLENHMSDHEEESRNKIHAETSLKMHNKYTPDPEDKDDVDSHSDDTKHYNNMIKEHTNNIKNIEAHVKKHYGNEDHADMVTHTALRIKHVADPHYGMQG